MIWFIVIISIIISIFILLTIFIGYKEFKRCTNIIPIDKRIQEIENEKTYVKLDHISKRFIRAVISIEDHRFYKHRGIDMHSIVRAILYNLKYRRLAQGGSTITQQLCKNIFFSHNKTIKRKIAEIFAAKYIEKYYSKDKILELYLNVIYFGEGYYGIKEASMGYFGVQPLYLNLKNSTLLAGCIQAPSIYKLRRYGELERKRQRQVLIAMIKYKNTFK